MSVELTRPVARLAVETSETPQLQVARVTPDCAVTCTRSVHPPRIPPDSGADRCWATQSS
jgi:hypothetical protein